MVSPVVLIIACYDSITFGFYVALNALTPVWLQKPVKQGGYGFDVTDNAACKSSLVAICTSILRFESYIRSLDWCPPWARVGTARI